MNTAFGVVDDLKIKSEQLLKPSENSLPLQSREILQLVYKRVDSFEEIAKTTLFQTDLEKAICSEVGKLGGTVAHIQVSSSPQEEEEDLKQRIHSFNRWLETEKRRCADGLYNTSFSEEEERDHVVTSKMIGARDMYEELKGTLMREEVVSLVGMPGIGKTTLANKVFNDPTIVERFDRRVWIRVGKGYRLKDIPRRILAEIRPDILPDEEETAVNEYLKEILKSSSYLIVLDDVWDRYITYLWHPYYRYKRKGLNHPFLHSESESRILITSRMQQLSYARSSLTEFDDIVRMRLLNEKESWDLLCDKVFGNGLSCPPQLEKAGKKISEKCEGLPLTILTVARLLSQDEIKSTPEYWNEIAAKKNHPLFKDAYNEILKILLSSYTYLPPLLQMCFLYIGLFPKRYEIPRSKLINLRLVDRFFELNININSHYGAIRYLEELVSNSVVMVYKKSTYNFTHFVKTCGLHSSLWHLSEQKAREIKFALILSSPDDCLGDGMEGHHRLSIHSNVLFGIKEVHKSVEDNCASTVRSLLCFGPYHQYQVPLCFRLKLLRELDALSIRFYEFPMEVLQLVWLTYLSLTSNGIIPTSISQLQFLEYFIVDQHQSIKSCKDALYLPVEIWSLSKLKHLEVGRDLPDPRGASLDNLLTLEKVSARSCTEVVLKGVPHLMELSFRIEVTPDDDGGKPLSCFTHVSNLSLLEKLKCVVVNPMVVPTVIPFSIFLGKYFRNLCLSGLGHPWKQIKEIASLPSLSVLKLKNYTFQGPVWKVEHGEFISLVSLVIEDTDLANWRLYGVFRDLRSLVIKNCYKLEKIHGEFGSLNLLKIEIVDCNPSCVKEMKKAMSKKATRCVLNVHSSWDDSKLKTTYKSSG